MQYMNKLKNEFFKLAETFNESLSIKNIIEGNITKDHYISLLREFYHYTRENPQLLTLATVSFRGNQRKVIGQLMRHAASEVSHDQLALTDIKTLGFDTSNTIYENPLPETLALTGYLYYQVLALDPIGLLGYIFFLEFLPTQFGEKYINGFAKTGVPKEAMTFLLDHTEIDVAHNRLMEKYVDILVTSEKDFNIVVYAMRVTANLYLKMIDAAFRRVTTKEHYGIDELEISKYPALCPAA